MVTLLMISITEPNQALRQAGLKRIAQGQVHRWRGTAAIALDELVDFAHHDLLDVAAAGKGLAHARGIHIELDGRRAPRQHVALEVRRNIERKGIKPRIHADIDLGQRHGRVGGMNCGG
jgi:hypothetical protein